MSAVAVYKCGPGSAVRKHRHHTASIVTSQLLNTIIVEGVSSVDVTSDCAARSMLSDLSLCPDITHTNTVYILSVTITIKRKCGNHLCQKRQGRGWGENIYTGSAIVPVLPDLPLTGGRLWESGKQRGDKTHTSELSILESPALTQCVWDVVAA